MLERRIDTCKGYRPVPISCIIQTANMFGCDIYMKSAKTKVNVKSYEELQNQLSNQPNNLIIYFDGEDEREADVRFQRIFQN